MTGGGGIAVLTCLFGVARDSLRARNFARFRAGLDRQGVPLCCVEAAVGDAPFLLPARDCVLQVRTGAALWHKERLLTLAAARLPPGIDKVVLCDADLVFENDDWPAETAELLETVHVAQPMAATVRLGPGATAAGSDDREWPAFAARAPHGAHCLAGGTRAHGHPGFAWALRRVLLDEVGLFDLCLSGSGDHLMAHGFAGDTRSACIQRHLLGAPDYARAFADWTARIVARTGGRMAAASGRALHLYHGPPSGAVYLRRGLDLAQAGFAPARDLQPCERGLYRPAPGTDAMAAWFDRHVAARGASDA